MKIARSTLSVSALVILFWIPAMAQQAADAPGSHEDLNVFGLFPFTIEPAMREVEEYLKSVKTYPNPPAPNITQFQSR